MGLPYLLLIINQPITNVSTHNNTCSLFRYVFQQICGNFAMPEKNKDCHAAAHELVIAGQSCFYQFRITTASSLSALASSEKNIDSYMIRIIHEPMHD